MKLTIKIRFVFIVNLNIEMSFLFYFILFYLLIVNLKTVCLSECFSVVNFI